MIETKRVVRILTDLEGINEDLLNLYTDIQQNGDVRDPGARRENLRLLNDYNEKLDAFESAAAGLRMVIERITHVDVARDANDAPASTDEGNERIIRQLDREQPHLVGEDFTWTRPFGFTLSGRAVQNVHTWNRFYARFLQQLALRSPERFAALPDSAPFNEPHRTTGFSRLPTDFKSPLSVAQCVYCEGTLATRSIFNNIRRLLAYFGIPEREMMVYLREDRDAE